ncbi:hypothetical protein F511_40139 [Dorcoceras hygrometricum]|uniref:Uncharacterized protein n=1 Tax=Dorcoceras hygrometricum TaxID=472368 RepID=A0A2Z7D172_9LAMI|nr:hypothetical protein F511_40139 [Dorcoceras hygrometricum]
MPPHLTKKSRGRENTPRDWHEQFDGRVRQVTCHPISGDLSLGGYISRYLQQQTLVKRHFAESPLMLKSPRVIEVKYEYRTSRMYDLLNECKSRHTPDIYKRGYAVVSMLPRHHEPEWILQTLYKR